MLHGLALGDGCCFAFNAATLRPREHHLFVLPLPRLGMGGKKVRRRGARTHEHVAAACPSGAADQQSELEVDSSCRRRTVEAVHAAVHFLREWR